MHSWGAYALSCKITNMRGVAGSGGPTGRAQIWCEDAIARAGEEEVSTKVFGLGFYTILCKQVEKTRCLINPLTSVQSRPFTVRDRLLLAGLTC